VITDPFAEKLLGGSVRGDDTRPLPRDGANYVNIYQSGYASIEGLDSRMEEVMPKMVRWRGSEAGQS